MNICSVNIKVDLMVYNDMNFGCLYVHANCNEAEVTTYWAISEKTSWFLDVRSTPDV